VESDEGAFFVQALKRMAGPILDGVRRAYGKKAAELEEPWDVLPTTHYNMGGVKTDEWCRSRVPGLYACGQAQGGVMGGNRLGSTSLTEIFAFGKRAGRTAALEAADREFADKKAAREPLEKLAPLAGSHGTYRPIQLKRALQEVMWEKVGPLRDGNDLKDALEEIRHIGKQATDLEISEIKRCNAEVADSIELPHMIASAEAITLSALARKESRGAHVRADFPERDDEQPVRNMVVEMKAGTCEVRSVETAK
jgi:fumarate reductase (CoM/CoB) subunit A